MRKRTSKKVIRRKKIQFGIRKKISGTSVLPRLSVFKSNKGVSAQLIDDVNAVTLASATYLNKDLEKGTKSEMAKQVGLNLAKKATDNNITEVVFDRSGYLFHGIIKALAEGAREGGLKF